MTSIVQHWRYAARRPDKPSPRAGTVEAFLLQRGIREFAAHLPDGGFDVKRVTWARACNAYCYAEGRYHRERFAALQTAFDLGGADAVSALLEAA